MRHVVGIADMKISADAGDVLITYGLGSCLGITIHDPVAHIGGMLHVMLPLSGLDPAKAADNPCMFVDTGVPKLFLDCYKAGAQKERLVVKVAGGAWASGHAEDDYFQIGRRNFLTLQTLLRKNGVLLQAHDVGGTPSRTLMLAIDTGEVRVNANGSTTIL